MKSDETLAPDEGGGAPAVVKVHRRQFLIGPEPRLIDSEWRQLEIEKGLFLSFCPELRTVSQTDREGHGWTVLGMVVEGAEGRGDPAESIAGAKHTDVPRRSDSWAGRWLLVGGGRVYLDASGLLGCFYGIGDSGDCWASSSPALLAEALTPAPMWEPDAHRLEYGRGISWFPPPSSGFQGMSRLLPNQILNLASGAVEPREFLPNIDVSRDFNAVVDDLHRDLATILRRSNALFGPMWLGLSAGADSRVMLSIAADAGVDVRPFTRISPRMSLADRSYPPHLARVCGYDHVFQHAPPRPQNRSDLVDRHSRGHVSWGDAEHIIRGVRDRMSGVMIGGHGWELASGWGGLHPVRIDESDPVAAAHQLADIFNEPSPRVRKTLETWLRWSAETENSQIPLADRFFLDQRQAGWLSAKEQLHDMARLERFPAMNAARIHEAILSVEPSRRLAGQIQKELIWRTKAQLLELPFNPRNKRLIHTHPIDALKWGALRGWTVASRTIQRL